MIMPEVIILNAIRSLIEFTRLDLKQNPESETFLWFIFNKDDNGEDLKVDTFKYFEQSKALFLKDKTKQRELDVFKGFNTQRSNLPTIHILMPNENMYFNGLGQNKGYDDSIITVTKQYMETYNNSYDATFSLLISSDNQEEISIIYNFLKIALVSIYDHFELKGLQNVRFSGADVTLDQDKIPNELFYRSLSMSFKYDVSIPSLWKNKLAIINTVKFEGLMLIDLK